jgi:transcriptional regulator with XRE-family HTH domain
MKNSRPAEQLITIGKRLKSVRNALQLSQRDMCHEFEVAFNTWHQWEAGKRLPDIIIMSKLCDRYGASLDWVFRGKLSNVEYALALRIKNDGLITDE